MLVLRVMSVALAIYMTIPAGDPTKATISIASSPTVDQLLFRHAAAIGDEKEAYRNHILRVLSYTEHFHPAAAEKRAAVEAALVYHDIGLWTDKTLAYLEPSRDRMRREIGSTLSPEDLELAEACIMSHHKWTPYEGPGADVVNAVRMADWVDASQGLVRNGMSRDNIAFVNQMLPNAGFHEALVNFGPRLHGWNLLSIVHGWSSIFAY